MAGLEAYSYTKVDHATKVGWATINIKLLNTKYPAKNPPIKEKIQVSCYSWITSQGFVLIGINGNNIGLSEISESVAIGWT